MMMTHLVANESWATVDLDLSAGRVLTREDWFYTWSLWPGVAAVWSQQEKVAIHRHIDRQIWGVWSGRASLVAKGTGNAAKQLNGKRLPLSMDVRWTTQAPGHWSVKIWKMPAGTGPTAVHRSFVDPVNRRIELNTADIAPRGAGNAAGGSTANFLTAPHEFGHTIGAPKNYPRDEYNKGHVHLRDVHSLMNVGRSIRARHLVELIKTLNRLAPGTLFEPAPGMH
jgi:hypothetical protein